MTPLADTALELARWQFALTTLFHFVFVPLTLGLAPLLAVMQTLWYRSRDERWRRLTRFFGTLFVINFAIGVATGLVMEFQFGMNWSAFSAYVGDVFGPLLAIEGIGAFMLEATFIGLWLFGWDRLSPRVHLATIYLVWIGVELLRTRSAELAVSGGAPRSLSRLFVDGALSNLSNPKIAVFYFAFLPQFVAPGAAHATLSIFVLGLVFAGLTFVIKGPVGLGAGMLSSWLRARPRALVWLYRTSGAVLVGLGVRLAFERRA